MQNRKWEDKKNRINRKRKTLLHPFNLKLQWPLQHCHLHRLNLPTTILETALPRHLVFTSILLATPFDVPYIHKIMRQMAIFESLTYLVIAIESSYSSTLFSRDNKPFHSFTVLILEVSQNPFTDTQFDKDPFYKPLTKVVNLDLPIDDPKKESFRTWHRYEVFVTGFVLFFPNQLTFFGEAWVLYRGSICEGEL